MDIIDHGHPAARQKGAPSEQNFNPEKQAIMCAFCAAPRRHTLWLRIAGRIGLAKKGHPGTIFKYTNASVGTLLMF
jgi:hypothetical protein